MITDSELRISNESYTRKDFYQIYPEILDLVGKITERWKPDESNESDPGVVLLKLLAFIADKTNYNIDKNILECFMPSATQNDSMRKLCDMMGYEMHYYRSAETEVSFMWTGKELNSTNQESEGSIILPAFETVITDDSKEVSYVLMDSIELTHRNHVKSGTAIEGAYCKFEINSDNIVRYYNLDDNLRLYLPESHVAENGIWIYNEEDKDVKRFPWTKVSNLNTQLPDTKVWKFGYDSKKKLPYIQFPQDVVELMNNGLSIFYIRTSGESGNINAKALTTLSNSTTVTLYKSTGEIEDVEISRDNNNYLTIQNSSGSVNGSDVESIDDAYNGFKKTVGTFDTLVTCRDYANAIYNLLDPKYNPYVSNVLVSDIRDNLNFSENVITLDQYGCHNIISPKKDKDGNPIMDHFDLYILPFKPITTSYNSKTFQNSFKPTSENYYDILNELENYKTISHNYKTLDAITNKDDIYCLKNKYKLKANISTTYKVNSAEEKEILNNIYRELYKNFNARKVDFGEEIPYDSVLKVIENADTRIKVVILEDFEISPWVMFANGNEYELSSTHSNRESSNAGYTTYRQMVAKNVLAGKLPLFNYDKSVKYKFGEKGDLDEYNNIIGGIQSYPYGEAPFEPTVSNSITYITTKLEIDNSVFRKEDGYEIKPNQSIQFLAPAYTSTITYPAYTNYFANIGPTDINSDKDAKPCELFSLDSLIEDGNDFGAIMLELKKSNIPNKSIYVQSSLPDYGKTPGYLVDKDYYKYSPITEYIAKRHFYCECKIIKQGGSYLFETDDKYTLGVDSKYEFIAKNTEYKLKSGEFLAIKFKDSSGNTHDIIYTNEKKTEWLNSVKKEPENFSGYIKFNFDLYNSKVWKQMGHRYVKDKSYSLDNFQIEGLFSLGASEEIEPRQLAEVDFNGSEGSYLKCYWYTNEPSNKLTFTKTDNNIFERILDSDEYFFYTNDMETILVTYGSGTVLRLDGSEWGSSNVWELPVNEEDSLSLDDVSSKGIGAFSDVNWQLKTIDNNKKLIIQESSIVNLGEGDSVSCSEDVVDSESGKIDSSWKKLTPSAIENLTYNEVNKLTQGVDWKVRSILNLNIGPACVQTLKSEEDDSIIEQIIPYTSAWYYKNKEGSKVYVNPLENDDGKVWDELTEELIETPIETFKNTSLKSNYLVQRSGGKNLSMHRYKTDKTELDDLIIVPFISENCEYRYLNGQTSDVEINDVYTKVNLTDLDHLSLPINIKENKFGIMSFYYTPGDDDDEVHIYIYPNGDHESGKIVENSMISEYKNMTWIAANAQPDNKYIHVLHEGLNCLRVDGSNYIIIHPVRGTHEGTLIFTQMDIINTKDGKNIIESGLDYKLLGLNPDESETPNENDDCNKFLKDYMINYDNFFYNAPISNENRIDVDSMNPAGNNYLGWNNVNNICNKFTIAELDVDSFSDIKIARPSKLY